MTAESLSLSNPMEHGRYMARITVVNSQKDQHLAVGRAHWALRQDSYQFGHPDAWYEVARKSFSQSIERWPKNDEMPQ